MKTNHIITACTALLLSFVGCKNAEDIQHAIYFTGTEVDPAIIYTIDGPQDVGFSVSASAPVADETEVTVAVAPELVEGFNALYGTNYVPLPAGSYEMHDDVLIIGEGQSRSASGKFSIVKLDDFKEGTTYCMPITIRSTSTNERVLEACRTGYIVFNRTIVTKVTNIAKTNYGVPLFETDPMVQDMKEVTFECRINAVGWMTSKPYISSIMGIEEYFFMRFGDTSIDPAQLQLAGGKYPTVGKTVNPTNKWIHIAVTDNGAQIKLYVNGELDGQKDAPRGTLSLKTQSGRPFYIGRTPQYSRPFNGYISEARVWSRALTANELKNNQCYVDPTSEGLVAYWRFNGDELGNGNVPDLTGHGFYAERNGQVPAYMEDVKCPE